ncbi:2OG-Fe(II) oxygenase [Dokdonella koreensis]|uniref:Proline hydroxylase-like protein n=1 Tax=Dokdonella koreensis DS-123 TaxID=1300342 RepID=A0A167GMM2_9GAMM|nr:2OG-Fe(II) oxygenase [Dokdonella koreensis]ANB16738.1 Proline hydroxylase-like protein [Dokdonella koreensis DS-123]
MKSRHDGGGFGAPQAGRFDTIEADVPLVGAGVQARSGELAAAFAAARPFRHAVIPDFLDRALCERLLADFPDFEARHALNEMGKVGGKAVRMDVRDLSDSYRALDALLQTEAFLGLISRITGIPDLLYDPDYIGGGTHENRDGQGLDAHVDFNYHPRTRWHRRINLIVYLNHDWHEAWGGALELHADPWAEGSGQAVRIAPTFNTCALFETTEHSWHGFSAIRLPEAARARSRKSFAIYLYTRERPAEETAPPHGTIYVPDAMPATWEVGRRLDEADVGDARRRFSRLRTQLRYLYDRERQFGAQIQALERALAEARAAQRLPLQGYATQPRGVSGLWPDGWVGPDLSAALVPVRAAKALELEVWAPPQLAQGTELAIRLGAEQHAATLRPGARTTLRLPLKVATGSEALLEIRSVRTWTPSADGSSGDERALAFRLLDARLVH